MSKTTIHTHAEAVLLRVPSSASQRATLYQRICSFGKYSYEQAPQPFLVSFVPFTHVPFVCKSSPAEEDSRRHLSRQTEHRCHSS